MHAIWLMLAPRESTSGSTVLYGALIGLGGVMVAALITQVFTQYRERRARQAEGQRQALYEFQDACFELRQAFRHYTSDPTPKQDRKLDRATSLAEIRKVRLLNDLPRIKHALWLKAAQETFLDGANVEIEDFAWQQLNASVSKALRDWQ
jgi:hypothetical protein